MADFFLAHVKMDTNFYDSNSTLLFKWARHYNIPSIYVIVKSRRGELIFEDSVKGIIGDISTNVSLDKVYDKYSGLNDRINPSLIIYFYIKSRHERHVENEAIIDLVATFDSKTRPGGATQFTSPNHIDSFKRSFTEQYNRYMLEDEEILDDINNMQTGFTNTQIANMVVTPIDVYGSTLLFRPIIAQLRKFPEPIDGVDIFDRARATKYVPFIQYNNEMGKPHFKIINGNINHYGLGIIHHQTKNTAKNTIYATVWLDDADDKAPHHLMDVKSLYDSGAIANSPSGSFYRLVYDINAKAMSVNMPNKTKTNQVTDSREVINRILVSFPYLHITGVDETKIRGSFDIYGPHIDELTFLEYIFSHPSFYRYLYTEEKLKPHAFKHRLDIHYHGLYNTVGSQVKINTEKGDHVPLENAGISLTLHLKRVTEESKVIEYISNEDGKILQGPIPKNVSYIRFIINGGTSIKIINECTKVLKVLLAIYSEGREGIRNNYLNAFGAYEFDSHNERLYTKNHGEKNRIRHTGQRVKALKDRDPELFVVEYASVCQSTGQPSIIEDDDVEGWEAETFFYKGKLHNRQALKFPRDNPKWNLVCTNSERPFPGVKTNNTLSNKAKYPYIPCCFKTDHMDPSADSHYNEYYNRKTVEVKTPKTNIMNRTNKIISIGQVAILPGSLENALAFYRTDDHPQNEADWKIVRTGAPRSANSLLHCVSIAINDPVYVGTGDQMEGYVRVMRNRISMASSSDLLKQELYDKSNEEIRDMFNQSDLFFDPDIFFRAVEEFYQINIYVFGVDRDVGSITIPRHKLLHARSMRLDRPTVLILNHKGSESDALDFPQCELIIDYNAETHSMIKIFGNPMTENCHKLLKGVSSSITWMQHLYSPVAIDQSAHPVFPHLNFFNSLSYIGFLGIGFDENGKFNLESQYIDPYGKARAFSLKIKGEGFTFVVPPTTPENAQHSSEVYTPRLHIIKEVMGNSTPTYRTIDRHGRTNGIWFQFLELEEGIYVPSYASKNNVPPEYKNLQIGSMNPIGKLSSTTNTKRYYKLKRSFHLLIEIVEWLYEVYKNEVGYETDVNSGVFAQHIFHLSQQDVGDTANFYDFSNMERILPNVNSLQAAKSWLVGKLGPMKGDRIIIYSNKFYNGIVGRIEEYKMKTYQELPLIPTSLTNYYSTTSDFKSYPNNLVMIGDVDMDKWQSDKMLEREKVFEIRTTLNLAIAIPLSPYLYIDPENKMWMIQNPSGNSMNAALAIARNWAENHVNTGPQTPDLKDNELPPHFVYIIAASGHLSAVEDHTDAFNNYVSIIKYNELNYGALLPLV